jgi:photosystem II stability/assembly factor-like uncharacterized protein
VKTPTAPTQARIERDAPAAAVLTPWGDAPVRVVLEAAGAAPRSAARAQLKERAKEDHPEGKALARLHHFDVQRGLPSPTRHGDGPTRRPDTPQARKLMRKVVGALVPLPAPAFRAAVQLPAWRELGPTLIPHGQTYGSGPGANPSVSGRCSGVLVDRSDSRHLVLCSAGGGLWGSRDAGATWAPLTDQQPTLVMGAIAQSRSQPNVMYAATGDGDGSIPYGMGLLRSADSGATWQLASAPALTGIGVFDIAIDPLDALRVWIGSDSALHFSANGGTTVRTAIGDLCWSVSVHPQDPREIFAACAGGLMRSTDAGTTWARVALPGTSAATSLARLEVCHAPSQPGVVFVAGCVGTRGMLWRRATVGGAFSAELIPAAIDVSQAWYDWFFSVAPHDPDLVYWGAIDIFRGQRSAAGLRWSNISSRRSGDSIHPDQHALTFDPADPRIVYACNDGGLFRSPDGGDHWQSLNPGLGITEFEFLAQLESDPAWLFGGTQDNGSLAHAGSRRWDQVALGDGGDCAAIDRGAASICYHSYYDMPIERAAAHGAQAYGWADVSPPTPRGYAALFYPPLEARGTMLVKAGATVWISANEGAAWDEIVLPTAAHADPDLASALHIVSDTLLLVGTKAGAFYRINRGSAGWSNAKLVKLSSPRRGYISDIASSGTTGRTLWVTVSSAGGGHVFRSTNSGNTWADRSAALPDIAVNAIVIDPKSSQRLYIATDRGVYRSSNSGTAWSVFSNGLPNVIVGDLLLHAGRRLLRAGTRSRGAWELSL